MVCILGTLTIKVYCLHYLLIFEKESPKSQEQMPKIMLIFGCFETEVETFNFQYSVRRFMIGNRVTVLYVQPVNF